LKSEKIKKEKKNKQEEKKNKDDLNLQEKKMVLPNFI
jgi:hypothetical protein